MDLTLKAVWFHIWPDLPKVHKATYVDLHSIEAVYSITELFLLDLHAD